MHQDGLWHRQQGDATPEEQLGRDQGGTWLQGELKLTTQEEKSRLVLTESDGEDQEHEFLGTLSEELGDKVGWL